MSTRRAMQIGMYCPVCNTWTLMNIIPPAEERDWEPSLNPRDCQGCGAKFMFDYAPAQRLDSYNTYNLDIPKAFYEHYRSMFGGARYYPIAMIPKENMPNVERK